MERRPLDETVAQVLYAARQLESALHGTGPWSMRWGSIEVPAERTLTDLGVTFTATFPDLCWLESPSNVITLMQAGEIVGIRPVEEHPGDTAFVVSWDLGARVLAGVA